MHLHCPISDGSAMDRMPGSHRKSSGQIRTSCSTGRIEHTNNCSSASLLRRFLRKRAEKRWYSAGRLAQFSSDDGTRPSRPAGQREGLITCDAHSTQSARSQVRAVGSAERSSGHADPFAKPGRDPAAHPGIRHGFGRSRLPDAPETGENGPMRRLYSASARP